MITEWYMYVTGYFFQKSPNIDLLNINLASGEFNRKEMFDEMKKGLRRVPLLSK